MSRMRVEVWGPHAGRFAVRHATARVVAVFARSLHLEAHGDFLCLGDPSIGHGPLNAILPDWAWAQLAATCRIDSTARMGSGSIRIGTAAVAVAHAAVWAPTPWRHPQPKRMAATLRQLTEMVAARAPDDGLVRVALLATAQPASALTRLAQPRVARLRAWLDGCRLPLSSPPPTDLLGLGPGLTPSGDDLLCGALVALRAVGWIATADRLAGAVAAAAPAATAGVSAAFLRAAAEGLGAEPLHTSINAVLAGDSAALPQPLAALGRIGHTSGWDALAGAALVLQAFSQRAVQPGDAVAPH